MRLVLKTSKWLLLLLLLFSFTGNLKAQVLVGVKMDTSMMLIGDQTKVTFEASFPDSLHVDLPIFSDTIIDKLEILNISDIDTIRENNSLKISQEYLVTCFDSGWYFIPPINFALAIPALNQFDTLQSRPIYFGVSTMVIDTVNANAITDIKAPIDAPITLREILPFVGIGFVFILLVFLAYVLYMKFAKKEPIFVKKEKPKEPAHIIAYRELDNLKKEKLWQKGQIKEYYSKLTEVVRVYIEARFGILAMESTTDEIMEAFRISGDLNKELKEELFDTLGRADFVKFAKANPLANENEMSLTFAYDFVAKTKPVVILRDEDENRADNKLETSSSETVEN
jgi:Na+-transporting methylmalonyl-CoA/oxaloacetate decarboxylase gamma subunit